MMFEPNSARYCLRLVVAAAIVAVSAVFVEGAMAQQWNEIAAPTGKEAVSRTYPASYRTDVFDVRVRGGETLAKEAGLPRRRQPDEDDQLAGHRSAVHGAYRRRWVALAGS